MIINQTGDMIVRPSAIEASVQVSGMCIFERPLSSLQITEQAPCLLSCISRLQGSHGLSSKKVPTASCSALPSWMPCPDFAEIRHCMLQATALGTT